MPSWHEDFPKSQRNHWTRGDFLYVVLCILAVVAVGWLSANVGGCS